MKTIIVQYTCALVTLLAMSTSDVLAQKDVKVYKIQSQEFFFTIEDENGKGPVNVDPDDRRPEGPRNKNPQINLIKGDRVKIILSSVEGSHDWTSSFGATLEVGETGSESVEFEANVVSSTKYYCSVGTHRSKGMEGDLVVHEDKSAMEDYVARVAAMPAAYDAEVDKLRSLSAGSMDPCLNAKYIAVRNENVRSILLRNLSNPDYVFKKVSCLEILSIPEYEHVLFDFDCRPGIFCLIDPNVLVTVDVGNGSVVDTKDPFLGGPTGFTTQRVRQSRAADNEIALVGTNNKRFRRGTQVNPTIKVKLGETVNVTLTSSGGTHDWTLVYVENGQEVKWADTPNTNEPAVSTGVFTANRVGTFDYFCNVSSHRADGMKGKFIVAR